MNKIIIIILLSIILIILLTLFNNGPKENFEVDTQSHNVPGKIMDILNNFSQIVKENKGKSQPSIQSMPETKKAASIQFSINSKQINDITSKIAPLFKQSNQGGKKSTQFNINSEKINNILSAVSPVLNQVKIDTAGKANILSAITPVLKQVKIDTPIKANILSAITPVLKQVKIDTSTKADVLSTISPVSKKVKIDTPTKADVLSTISPVSKEVKSDTPTKAAVLSTIYPVSKEVKSDTPSKVDKPSKSTDCITCRGGYGHEDNCIELDIIKNSSKLLSSAVKQISRLDKELERIYNKTNNQHTIERLDDGIYQDKSTVMNSIIDDNIDTDKDNIDDNMDTDKDDIENNMNTDKDNIDDDNNLDGDVDVVTRPNGYEFVNKDFVEKKVRKNAENAYGYNHKKPGQSLYSSYGYSYMPPESWSVPQNRPPVCIPQKGFKADVLPVFTSGMPLDTLEIEQTMLPKFKYTEVYDPKYYYPGWTSK